MASAILVPGSYEPDPDDRELQTAIDALEIYANTDIDLEISKIEKLLLDEWSFTHDLGKMVIQKEGPLVDILPITHTDFLPKIAFPPPPTD
jgi:hypothetical protein